jgi:hypothetical protein
MPTVRLKHCVVVNSVDVTGRIRRTQVIDPLQVDRQVSHHIDETIREGSIAV